MKTFITFVTFFAFVASSLWASGQTTADFLKLAGTPRTLAMGQTGLVFPQNADALIFNPAGLVHLPNAKVSMTHTDYLVSLRLGELSLAFPKQGLGLDILGLYSRDFRRDEQGATTGRLIDYNLAVTAGVSRNLTSSLSAGASLKSLSYLYADTKAHGAALDMGLLYKAFTRGPRELQVGLTLQNVGPSVRFPDESAPLPTSLGLGLGYRIFPMIAAFQVNVAAHDKTKFEAALGAEYTLLQILSLRVGHHTLAKQLAPNPLNSLTTGFGLNLTPLITLPAQLDYAFIPYGRLGNEHRFGVSVGF